MRRSAGALLVGVVFLLPGLARPAAGQSGVSARLGENADAATGVATGQAFAVGFTRVLGVSGFAVGLGLPTDPTSGTAWGTGAGWLDVPRVLSRVGLTGSVQGFAYRDPLFDSFGAGVATDLRAYHDFPIGPGRLRIRGGGRAGLFGSGSAPVRRALFVAGSEITLTRAPFLLRASADAWSGPEDVYPELSGIGVVSWRGLLAHLHVTRWLHDDLPDTGWSVGVELPLLERLALVAHAARPAQDILFWTPPQSSWSLGLRWNTGPVATPIAAPAVIEADEPVQIEVSAAAGAPVRVAGTFNDWQPVVMRREDDRWVIDLALDPGVYEFAFVAGDGTWFVPEGTPGRKPDGFGGFVGTLVVR